MTERLLRVPEVAERLSLGRQHTYTLIAKGILPSIRINCAVRVPESALERFIAERTRHPEADLVTGRR